MARDMASLTHTEAKPNVALNASSFRCTHDYAHLSGRAQPQTMLTVYLPLYGVMVNSIR